MILFITESAIASVDVVSSRMHPKYFTSECCIICISPYFIFSFLSFFILNLVGKSINLVLLLLKWILSLLLTNQSEMLSKSLLSCFSISLISLWWQTRHVSSAYRKRLHLRASDISLIYMRKSREPRIGPCGIPLETHAGWENASPRLTKNVLFMR